MISARAVRFSYGKPLLVDVDLEVASGELLGIIGPNGAGKSTLARLLLGLVAPQSGRVTVDDRDLHTLPARARARLVAAVLQDEPLEFPFTALEVVLMGRRARLGAFGFERPDDLAAAERAMRDTGVFDLADRPLSELSGGERKRVLLARALAQDTPVLILDEPAAALDIRHQLDLFALLDARRKGGAAVAVVVHDLNLAATFCTRLALLSAGAPAVVGSVAEVLTEARLRSVFGVEVAVGSHPVTGARVLFPLRGVE
ncbi:MAG: btuD [Myxococcales bacterium]|nr:btuD [Myxococcales bacterium]